MAERIELDCGFEAAIIADGDLRSGFSKPYLGAEIQDAQLQLNQPAGSKDHRNRNIFLLQALNVPGEEIGTIYGITRQGADWHCNKFIRNIGAASLGHAVVKSLDTGILVVTRQSKLEHPPLTPAEKAVLGCALKNPDYPTIAAKLESDEATARKHMSNIARKLQVSGFATTLLMARCLKKSPLR